MVIFGVLSDMKKTILASIFIVLIYWHHVAVNFNVVAVGIQGGPDLV